MERILECVPNFSEGKDPNKINAIVDEIKKVKDVYVLDVEMGHSTNRTVVTFAGEPNAVVEAAFYAIKKASELIDMKYHKGEHPRIGATDVCPLIPIKNISIQEAVNLSIKLAQKVGEELGIPVYLYEYSAKHPWRKHLSQIRSGEYEALKEKLSKEEWKPDFGPHEFSEKVRKTGATVIGVRKILIAYNINLNTRSLRIANAIANDLREKGRQLKYPNILTGTPVKNWKGEDIWIEGHFPTLRAIGWFIEEYDRCQISINITDVDKTPLHLVYELTKKSAEKRGVSVTGSEIIGLIPESILLDAGTYFLKKQKRTTGIPKIDIIQTAIQSLGLSELKPFNFKEKVIEYALQKEVQKNNYYLKSPLETFIYDVLRDKVVPGGGSVGALLLNLGCALAGMVANASANKRGNEHLYEDLNAISEKTSQILNKAIEYVDKDALNFKNGMAMMKSSPQDAFNILTEVPFAIINEGENLITLLQEVKKIGMKEALSDTGTAVACAMSAIYAGIFNILINITKETPNHQKHTALQKVQEGLNLIKTLDTLLNDVLKELLNNSSK